MPIQVLIIPTSNVPHEKRENNEENKKAVKALWHFVIALAEATAEPEGRDVKTRIHRIRGAIAVAFRELLSAGEKR